VTGNFGDQVETDLGRMHGGHLGVKDVAPRHHIGLHPRMCAQHAGHVLGLCAYDNGRDLIPMFGNPAASRHGNSGIGSLPCGSLRYESRPSCEETEGA
jgi:hypothetical protein